jgi:limonene-1,2-epoxide hydrolase
MASKDMAASKADIVKQFFALWARQDHAAVLALLHDDIEYQNMPFPDVMKGKAPIAAFMAKFGKGMQDINVNIRNMAEVGDIVFHEGVENYTRKGNKVSLPYVGVFEFKDGKIIGWRDYFDYTTLERQLSAGKQAKAAS